MLRAWTPPPHSSPPLPPGLSLVEVPWPQGYYHPTEFTCWKAQIRRGEKVLATALIGGDPYENPLGYSLVIDMPGKYCRRLVAFLADLGRHWADENALPLSHLQPRRSIEGWKEIERRENLRWPAH